MLTINCLLNLEKMTGYSYYYSFSFPGIHVTFLKFGLLRFLLFLDFVLCWIDQYCNNTSNNDNNNNINRHRHNHESPFSSAISFYY